MSDATSTPADPAVETAPDTDQQPARDAVDAEVAKIKAEARKWEARAKENSAAAKRLAELEDAQKTEAERAAERLTATEKRAIEAEARALRREVALDAKLTREDAELLDLLTDEDAIRRLAERLSTPTRTTPLPDPTAGGGQGAAPSKSAAQAFADFTSEV